MKSLFYKQARGFSFNYPCPRNLREIMKMSLIEKEPPHQVKEIWTEYHKQRHQNIADVLTKDEHLAIRRNALESPMFLVPVKRKGGHFMLLGQNQTKTFLFTYLEDFKKLGTKAQPYFVMTIFDELLFQKGISLVRGDILDFKLTKDEAQDVFNNTRRLMTDPDLYHRFVLNFNKHPDQFNYNDFSKHFDLPSAH